MHRRVIVPSRINIIGEHTDYAGGLALPFAIDVKLELIIKPLETGFSGDEIVIALWQAAGGYPAELIVNSEIPIGKGMSSSAALCVAITVGANPNLEQLTICKMAQQLEHQILGTPCGLLDQMAMVFAKENHATLINFDDYSIDYVALPESWKFKLVDSGIHRNLADVDYKSNSEYQQEHVSNENDRVLRAINSNAETLGRLLNESHESLQKLGVSLIEMDTLVKTLQDTEGVLGARMMGGGYGGMILVLVVNDDVLPEATTVSSSSALRFEEFG